MRAEGAAWQLVSVTLTLVACRDVELPGPPGAGSFQGRVVSAVSGSSDRVPASGARVSTPLGFGAVADSEGYFRIDGVLQPLPELLFRWDSDGDGGFDRGRMLELESRAGGLGLHVNLGDVVLAENGSVGGKAVRGDLSGASGHAGTMAFVPEGPFAAFTADNGAFNLRELPEGVLRLGFFRSGYRPAGFDRVRVGSGELTVLEDVVLEPAPPDPGTATLSGTVTLVPEGDPAGARVELIGVSSAARSVEVSTAGSFSFSSLASDVYALTATYQGHASRVSNLLLAPGGSRSVVLAVDTRSTAPVEALPSWFGGDAGSVAPDAGSGADGGSDGGSGVDAGTDAGTETDGGVDAGTDGGAAHDAGSDAGVDAGSGADAGRWLELFLNDPPATLNMGPALYDNAGTLWAGLSYEGLVQRNGPTLVRPAGEGDVAFLSRYSPSGALLQTFKVSHDGGAAVNLRAMAELAPGELLLLLQSTRGVVSFEPPAPDYTVSPAFSEVFRVRLFADGGSTVVGSMRFTSTTSVNGLIHDGAGRAWGVGTTADDLLDPSNNVGCNKTQSTTGGVARAFVWETAPDAGCVWAHSLNCGIGTNISYGDDVAYAPDAGRLYVLGHTLQPCNTATRFGTAFVPGGTRFVAMYELPAPALPSFVLPLPGLSTNTGRIVELGGRIYIASSFSGTLTTLGAPVSSDGGADLALAELAVDAMSPALLGLSWAAAYGSRANEELLELRTDAQSRVHLVTRTLAQPASNGLSFGGPVFFAAGPEEVVAATLALRSGAPGFDHVSSFQLTGGDAGFPLYTAAGFEQLSCAVSPAGSTAVLGRRPPTATQITGFVTHTP